MKELFCFVLFFRQFGDVNPNSIELSYYERTINATLTNGANHIHGDYHVYSLFYGISNVPATNSRRFITIVFSFFASFPASKSTNFYLQN